MTVKLIKQGSLLLCLCVLIFGCNLFSSPRRTAIKFYWALDAGKSSEANEMISNYFKTNQGSQVQGYINSLMNLIRQNGGLESIEITGDKTSNRYSELTIELAFKNGTRRTIEQPLIIEDGVWKINNR